jgi:hypothetical protein
MDTIILQEVVHLPGSFNFISQSQIIDNEIKVEPVNYNSLNLCNRLGMWSATAPQVDGLCVLDHVLDRELTEYTDIDNSCQVALRTTGHASRHDEEKGMVWPRRRTPVGLKALEILLKVIAKALKMTGKCDCKRFINCKLTRKPFTRNTTSRATVPLHPMYSEVCSPLETAIGGGPYMLLIINNETRHTDGYALKHKLKALEKIKQ